MEAANLKFYFILKLSKTNNCSNCQNPINMLVTAIEISPKMMITFQPNLSANTPLTMLPIRLPINHKPKISPTSVMPTLNFYAINKDRKGKINAPPRQSINVEATLILNDFGTIKIHDLRFLIIHHSFP